MVGVGMHGCRWVCACVGVVHDTEAAAAVETAAAHGTHAEMWCVVCGVRVVRACVRDAMTQDTTTYDTAAAVVARTRTGGRGQGGTERENLFLHVCTARQTGVAWQGDAPTHSRESETKQHSEKESSEITCRPARLKETKRKRKRSARAATGSFSVGASS